MYDRDGGGGMSRRPHYVHRERERVDRNHKRKLFNVACEKIILSFLFWLLYGGASGDQKHFRLCYFHFLLRDSRV